jgi:hypothetical protein
MPPALVATLPPRLEEYSPGNTGYTSPCGAIASSSWSRRTPGPTTAIELSVSISMMSAIASVLNRMPAASGTAPPDRPVPAPRAVTVVPL